MPTTRPTRPTRRPHGLSHQLVETIESRGLTAYALAKMAGVNPSVVHRFLSGERDLTLESADRLAQALGLRLVEVAARKGRPAPARPQGGA